MSLKDAIAALNEKGIGLPGQADAMDLDRLRNRLSRQQEIANTALGRRAEAIEQAGRGDIDPELLSRLGDEALNAVADAELTRQQLTDQDGKANNAPQ